MAIRDAEPDRFERAALRWIARYCLERPTVALSDVHNPADAFEPMAQRPEDALVRLQRLCR